MTKTFSFTESQNGTKVNLGALKLHLDYPMGRHPFQPHSEIFANPDTSDREDSEWKSILDEILDILFQQYPKETNFYISADTEILWTEFLKSKGVFEYLKNKFKDRTLILRDGNLHPHKPDFGFKWESECIFFGGSAIVSDDWLITQRQFSRTFTCLQTRQTGSRKEIYQHLYDNNLLYKTFYTYDKAKTGIFYYREEDGTDYSTSDENNMQVIHGKPVLFYPSKFNLGSFCNIVTESCFYPNDLPDTTHNKIFFTEKIEKCFTAAQPFILVGNRNGLAKLREFGFKTFGDFWDESYDEDDDTTRMLKIKKIISEIGSWSLMKCQEVYIEMADILEHNQKHNKTFMDKKYTLLTDGVTDVSITHDGNKIIDVQKYQ
jgi:hypothetical protein